MKVEGIDKKGIPWYVESDGEIEVKVCQHCGNPALILNPSPDKVVSNVTLYKRTIAVGEFPTGLLNQHMAAIAGKAVAYGGKCPWCGSEIVL